MSDHTLQAPDVTGRRGTRLREVAYQAIKEGILQGTVRTDLPLVEERLAAQLSISRTPVREALALLEHEGMIESVPYQGLFVKAITTREFLEMYEAAEVIEPELARRAALHSSPSSIAAMEALLEEAERCIPDDAHGHLAACRKFQRKMGECADQPYLTSLLLNIEERSDLHLISKWSSLPPEKMLAAVSDRRAILEALRAGDAVGAANAARNHARDVRQRWLDLYGQEL